MTDDNGNIGQAGLRDRVRTAVGEVVQAELALGNDDAALNTLFDRYDSLGVLDCVGQVEREFGISVDLVDDDLRSTFVSVASIAELARRKLADQAVLGSGF